MKFQRDDEVLMFRGKQILPDGDYYTLTWTIQQVFGGMTSVVLQRSTAFSRIDRRRVEILTLSPDLNPSRRERDLKREGRLGSRVRVRNLWTDLRSWSDKKLIDMVGTVAQPVPVADEILPRDKKRDVERKNPDGEVLQVDRYRRNGTLLVSDRRDVRERGKLGGRRITLFSRKGKIIGQWTTARRFYHSWFDAVTADRQSVIICDSSFVAGMIHDYRRNHVTMVQVLHSHHLRHPGQGILGPLASGKYDMLTHADSYDMVAALTSQQRKDILSAHLSAGNVTAVSNTIDPIEADVDNDRDAARGIMVGRLSKTKRIDHAIEALARSGTADVEPTLDVYGDGELHETLSNLITEHDMADRVTLKGYDPAAKSQFASASFTVLTSRFEGQPLVLLESMSAGCIPIAYDIEYGPSDIITDKVDGFLVPAGDIDAMGAAIDEVATMDPEDLRKMRKAAQARAADFYETPVVKRWAQAIEDARSRKQPVASPKFTAKVATAEFGAGVINLSGTLSGVEDNDIDAAHMVWNSRRATFFGRTPCQVGQNQFTAAVPIDQLHAGSDKLIDFHLDLILNGNPVRRRLPAPAEGLPVKHDNVELYTTAHRNLSIRLSKS